MKTETWNKNTIRFVEKTPGEWWAVAKGVAEALAYANTAHMVRMVDDCDKGIHIVDTPGGSQEMLIISEFGIYEAIFSSRKPEAKDFKRWVYEVIQTLRQESGLAGYEVFRMLDKEHQKQAMQKLRNGLTNPVRVDFIKANVIANKTVSNIHGFPKMVKKGEMSPAMLRERETVLDDTVRLMEANDSFKLGLSVSDSVYRKYCN